MDPVSLIHTNQAIVLTLKLVANMEAIVRFGGKSPLGDVVPPRIQRSLDQNALQRHRVWPVSSVPVLGVFQALELLHGRQLLLTGVPFILIV